MQANPLLPSLGMLLFTCTRFLQGWASGQLFMTQQLYAVHVLSNTKDQLQTFKRRTNNIFFAALPFTASMCYLLLSVDVRGYNPFSIMSLANLTLILASLLLTMGLFQEIEFEPDILAITQAVCNETQVFRVHINLKPHLPRTQSSATQSENLHSERTRPYNANYNYHTPISRNPALVD